MTLTRARTIQYIGILFALGLIAAGYWYWQASAGVKRNTSVAQPQGTGRLDAGLAGYWPLDNGSGTTATDLSTNSNNGTLTNGPTWSTGQIGGAVDFDGSNDHVAITDHAVFDIVASQQYSWSMWINPDGFAEWSDVWAQGASTTSGFYIYAHTSTNPDWHVTQGVAVGYIASSGNILTTTSYDNVLTTGQWQHVTVTYDGSQSTANRIRIYVNGVNQTDPSGSVVVGTLATISPDQIWLGRNPDYLAEVYDGDIDEFRYYNRALSMDEIGQLYRLTTPTSVDTSLKGYWSFNATDISGTVGYDRSGAGNHGTLTNGPVPTKGVSGQALQFDGTNDELVVPDSASLRANAGSLTLSAWVKAPNTSQTTNIMSKRNPAGNFEQYSLGICGDDVCAGSGKKAVFFMRQDGSNYRTFLTASDIADGNWHYIVGVANQAANTVQIYVDGAPAAGATSSAGSWPTIDNTDSFRVGSANTVAYMNGPIDEVRVYNRALGSEEIKSLYEAVGPDEMNSSVSQLGGAGRLDSALSGYWKLDETTGSTAADSSVNGNNGTLNNMENGDWTTGRIGNGLSFDGAGEYVSTAATVPSRGSLGAWVNTSNSLTNTSAVYTFLGATTGGNYINIQFSGYTTYNSWTFGMRGAYGTDVEIDGPAYTDNSYQGWHHILVTWDTAQGATIYVDGAYYASTTSTTGIFDPMSLNINISDSNNDWLGLIDEVRMYDRILAADEVSQLYRLTTPTAVDTDLKGYWSFDAGTTVSTTAYDLSGARNNGTLVNSPARTIGRVGQALHLDGTDDYVNAGSASNIDDLVNLSACAWVYPETLPDTYKSIIGQMNNGGAESTFGFFSAAANPRLTYYRTFSGTAGEWDAPIGAVPVNEWSYVCMTYNNSSASNDPIFYINGVSAPVTERVTPSGTASTTGGGDYFIGALDDGASGDEFLDGKLDEVRLYSRILSAAEIKSLYDASNPDKMNTSASQSQGTGRLDSGLIGYWRLDDGTSGATPTTAADSSAGGNNGTLTGGPTWTTGQIGNAVTFDGTNDYVTMGDVAAVDGLTELTVSAWAKSSSLTSERTIVAKSACNGAGDGGPFSMGAGYVTGIAEFVIYPSGGSPTSYYKVEATRTIDDGNWHLVTGVYDGASARIYIDGALSAVTAATGAGDLASTSYTLDIGRCSGAADYFWNNGIDEVRIYNRALSSDEVGQLYRVTSPTGTETNLRGYWSFNGQDMNGTTAIDRSGAGNNGTLTNGPTRTIGKFGQALDFDGTNDSVSIADSATLPNNSSFTYTGWFFRDTFTTDDTVVAKRNGISSADDGVIIYIDDATDQLIFEVSNGSDEYSITSTSTFTTAGWNFFTVVWNAAGPSTSKMYINGVDNQAVHDSGTWSISDPTNALSLLIGTESDGGNPFDGKIDEVRLYNRTLSASEVKALYEASR